jgi:hypothetical protein
MLFLKNAFAAQLVDGRRCSQECNCSLRVTTLKSLSICIFEMRSKFQVRAQSGFEPKRFQYQSSNNVQQSIIAANTEIARPLGRDHPRWGMGGDGGMGAWSPLRYALRPRGAAAGFSPGASRPDGLATPVEKKKYSSSAEKLYMYLPELEWHAGCMASAVVEGLAYGRVSMGLIPTNVQFCKKLEICISGTRVRILQGACW